MPVTAYRRVTVPSGPTSIFFDGLGLEFQRHPEQEFLALMLGAFVRLEIAMQTILGARDRVQWLGSPMSIHPYV